MPDPRTPSDYESVSTPVEAGSTDDGFNRRLGLGLVISIGANVLLLQGAGLLAKNMSLNAPTQEAAVVLKTIPKSQILPSPTPTPAATPTPKTPEKVAVKPTPKPRTPPTPRPEQVKPTPKPLHERVRPTPVPTPEPVSTPPPVAVATPKPVENAATTTAANTPARSAESPRQSSASNNVAAKGTKNPAPAIANRTSTAAPEFKQPTIESATIPVVHDLPSQTLSGAVKAIFSPSAGARSAASATSSATAETITQNTSVTTSQRKTISGRVSPGTQRVAVMTARPSTSAADTFVLPTTGGTAKPGSTLKFQGNSASSTVAAMSASARTTMMTGGSGTEPAAIVNGGASTVAVGPVGVFRPGRPVSNTIGATLADIGHKGGNGTGSGISLSSNAIGGTNNGHGGLTAASEGTSNASYGAGAGRGSGAGLSANGTSLVADATGGSGGGLGGNGVHAAGGNGRGGHAAGPHAGSVGGGVGKGNNGSGDVGLDNGAIGGHGNGKALVAGAMTGGTAEGIGTTNHSGPLSNGTAIKAVTSNGGPKGVSGGVKQVTTDAQATDKEAGRTSSAIYRIPSKPPIPESLKAQTFDVTVTVRGVISSTGQVRATILKSSGYPALDDAAVNAVSNMHISKVAYQDGSPASDTHEFNFTFNNKG